MTKKTNKTAVPTGYGFEKGQLVRATVTAQGLTQGRVYRVLNVVTEDRAWLGTYVTYCVREDGPAFSHKPGLNVVNGRFVLEPA